jgi:hypothetical protein
MRFSIINSITTCDHAIYQKKKKFLLWTCSEFDSTVTHFSQEFSYHLQGQKYHNFKLLQTTHQHERLTLSAKNSHFSIRVTLQKFDIEIERLICDINIFILILFSENKKTNSAIFDYRREENE